MSSTSDSAREQLARPLTPELYAQIRRLWIEHSLVARQMMNQNVCVENASH